MVGYSTLFSLSARKDCMRFNIRYLLWAVKCCSKTWGKKKKKKYFWAKFIQSLRHLGGCCKYITAIFVNSFIYSFNFERNFIQLCFHLFCVFFLSVFQWASLLARVFRGSDPKWSTEELRKHFKYIWRTVLESILSIFAVNIPTRCLILSAEFIHAQRSLASQNERTDLECVAYSGNKEQITPNPGSRHTWNSHRGHFCLSHLGHWHKWAWITLLTSVEMDHIFRSKKQRDSVNKWFMPNI